VPERDDACDLVLELGRGCLRSPWLWLLLLLPGLLHELVLARHDLELGDLD
jgi:hypothetical protein